MAIQTRIKSARPAKEAKAKAPKKPARKSKAAAAPKHKDAKLLALYDQYREARKIMMSYSDAVCEALDNGEPDDVVDAAETTMESAADHASSLCHRIATTPAKTVEGIKIKALTLALIYPGDMDKFLPGATTDVVLVRQIIDHLLTV